MLRQINEITWMNLRNLSARPGASFVIVVGMAGVVAVLVALLSMSAGFRAALAATGAPDRALIVRNGTTQELNGWVSGVDLLTLSQWEGIVAASGEVSVAVDLISRATGKPTTAMGRGVDWTAFDVRPELEIVNGRRFEPGRNEMIVGVGALAEYRGLELGAEVQLRDSTWTVVGQFDGAGSAYAAEIWMDLAQVQGTFRRQGGVSTVRVRLDDPSTAATLKQRLRDDPRFELDLITEPDWYAEQSRTRSELIEAFAYLVTGIMAFGAVIAALNTMYSAVSTRTVEIATLRALGFGNAPIVVSVLVEALLLAFLGSVLGGAVVFLVFDGYATSTLNSGALSQIAFEFTVTQPLLLLGIYFALGLGFVSGMLPALRAARLPILVALRAG